MSVTIVLGRSRRRRRAAMKHGVFTGVDGNGRPNFLYLTDTLHKSQLVSSEFAKYRDGASFLPEVRTVASLLGDLHRRFGDGRVFWPEAYVVQTCRRLRTAHPDRWPWLASLAEGPAIGQDLARLFHDWLEASGDPRTVEPRVRELFRFFEALAYALRGHPDYVLQGDAIRQLAVLLSRHPEPSLGAWLHLPHAVVIDDVLHPSAARIDALLALTRAWNALLKHVVFGLESGRDLGGAEAGSFFQYDDATQGAFSLRPFEATRSLRLALFEGLIASDAGGDIAVADAHGQVTDALIPEDRAEDADLADRLWCRSPLPPPDAAPWLEINAWPDRTTEVQGIAQAVREALVRLESAEDLWVAFPALPAYLPELARIFGDLGIPWKTSAGLPLQGEPPVRRLAAMARWATERWPLDPVMEASLSSPWAAEHPALEALWRVARERGLTSARDLDRLEDPALAPCISAVQTAMDLGAPLRGDLEPAAWAQTLRTVAAAFGVWATKDGHDPATEALSLVSRVAREAAVGDQDSVPATWLADALDALLADTLVPVPTSAPRGVACVQVVGVRDLRGIHPPRLWIGGLTADVFPAPPRDDYLLPREARSDLGLPDPGDESRYIFASALRNAQDSHTYEADIGVRLTLSWPSTQAGKTLARSSLVQDLLGLWPPTSPSPFRTHNGPSPAPPAGPRALDAWLGAAFAAGHPLPDWAPASGAPAPLPALGPLRPRAELLKARSALVFGRFDGLLRAPPPKRKSLGLTSLEQYLKCPMASMFKAELGLTREEAFDRDVTLPVWGTLVHAILHQFVLEQMRRGVRRIDREGVEDARVRLDRVARRLALQTRPDKKQQHSPLIRLLPALSAHRVEQLVGGLTDANPPGVLHAWLEFEADDPLHHTFEQVEQDMGTGLTAGELRLQGKIDRVDRLAGGAPLVIDYKTGNAPTARHVLTGLNIQGLIYLEAAESGSVPGAATYLQVHEPGKAKRDGWVGDPEVVAQVEKATPLDPAQRAELRAYVNASARRLAAGTFHPTLAEPSDAGCEHCAYKFACKVQPGRNARILEAERAAGRTRYQAPLADSPAARGRAPE